MNFAIWGDLEADVIVLVFAESIIAHIVYAIPIVKSLQFASRASKNSSAAE